MSTTTNVKQIKLNKMTSAQYDAATKSATEFYTVVDESIDYNDLVNKPTIGTGTLTIQKNGVNAVVFSANETTNKSINIVVPTSVTDLSDGSNYALISSLSTVATTGNYNDLSNKPTISSLTTTAQLNAINSGATAAKINQIATNQQGIADINSKIPSTTSTSNQLADKAFVNSSINSVAAFYITSNAAGSAFATKANLLEGPYYFDGSIRIVTQNDYAIVLADETHSGACTRYVFTGSQWSFQYVVNDTSFTQAQLDAINSGITSTKVGNYDTHIADTTIHVTSTDKTNWDGKVDKVSSASKIYGTNSSSAQTTYSLSSSATASTIAYRGTGGVLSVGTPTANAHAATKAYVDGIIPSQSGNSGKYLTTNGTSVSWASVDALPSQSGNSGKFLTTDGSAASWVAIEEYTASEVETLWASL